MKQIKKVEYNVFVEYETCPLCGRVMSGGDDEFDRIMDHIWHRECPIKAIMLLPPGSDRVQDELYRDTDGDLWVLDKARDYDLIKPIGFYCISAEMVIERIIDYKEKLQGEIAGWNDCLVLLKEAQ